MIKVMRMKGFIGMKGLKLFLLVDLTSLLLSSARDNLSPQFACKVLKFFNKLLQLGKNLSGFSFSVPTHI